MFKKTVNNVVAKMNKLVAELEDVAVMAEADMVREDSIIQKALDAHRVAAKEKERATRVMGKISELIS